MKDKFKDTDLREALRRKYANTPQLPADFMASMEKRLQPQPMAKTRRLWRWISAAACLIFLIGVGITIMPTDQQAETGTLIAKQETTKTTPRVEKSTTSSKESIRPNGADSSSERSGLPVRTERTVSKQAPKEEPEAIKEGKSSVLDDDPNLHYASYEANTDTLPYQDPARMDDFIAKMASYYGAEEGELKCSSVKDSNVVSTVYVLPDKKTTSSSQQEVDVFSRLLQAACWYHDETPGYLLSFSRQQFFFELKDMRRQLHYRWIAERINGKILLYSTQAPLGTKVSSTCYQEYRDELMHIKSINNKTKKI